MALLYFPHQRVEISFLVRRQPQTQILSGSYIGNWIGRHSCLTLINSPIPSAQASTPQLWSFLNQPSQQPDKRRQDSIIHLFHSLRKFLQSGQFLSTLVIEAPHVTPLHLMGRWYLRGLQNIQNYCQQVLGRCQHFISDGNQDCGVIHQ